jgi:two-component system, sensor histidine kinase and response regulator
MKEEEGRMVTPQPCILLVDDDAALLQALPEALALRMPAIQVQVCVSAVEALERIRQYDYDAIVSDIKMPGMDGFALLTRIKGLRPETPTLLITGHGERDLTIQALRGGAYDFIQKPIDRDYFVAALQRAIQAYGLRRQVREQQQALERHAQSLEALVEERTRELVEANAAKDVFLGLASHELRTPLTTIKGNIQLARMQLTKCLRGAAVDEGTLRITLAEIHTMLERAERQVNVQNRMVNDLLNLSRIQADKLELRMAPCDLAAIVREAVEDQRSAAPTRTIHLELAEREKIPVFADAERIQQVISNYLTNALKYSSEDHPVEVRLEKEGKMARVSVCDEGPGLTPSEQEQVWEQYFRVQGITKQRGFSMGLGLGLYICRAIIEQHQGEVGVESTKGMGSTFWFTLLLAENDHPVAL